MKNHKSIHIDLVSYKIKILFHYSISKSLNKHLFKDILNYYKQYLSESSAKYHLLINIFKSCSNSYKGIVKNINNTTYTYLKLAEVKNNEIRLEDNISLMQLNYILATYLNKLILTSGGIILHASAAKIKDKVMVFTGNSGSGKSTIVRLLKHFYQPFADDQVIILKKNGRFYCFQSLFVDKSKHINLSKNGYKIESIVFLQKSGFDKRELIQDKNKIMQLFSKQITTDINLSKKQFSSFTKLLNQTIFYKLFFTDERRKFLTFFNKQKWNSN